MELERLGRLERFAIARTNDAVADVRVNTRLDSSLRRIEIDALRGEVASNVLTTSALSGSPNAAMGFESGEVQMRRPRLQ